MLLCFDVFTQECPNSLLLDIGIILHKLGIVCQVPYSSYKESRVSPELWHLLCSFSCSHADVKLRKSPVMSEHCVTSSRPLLAPESHYPWVTCGPPLQSPREQWTGDQGNCW